VTLLGPEPDSFEDFYLETVERTLATARRLADNHDVARDATQDAYVVMLERWAQRQHESCLHNHRYVIGIVANKIADWYRRAGRFVPLTDNDDQPEKADHYAEALDRLTVFKEVRWLLESQPARRRMIGILYFLDELEYAEIARALDIASSTVRTQVERLRGELKPLVSRLATVEEGGARS
jgi:RNA polymerase sigma factor (sigma-70 family)